MTSYWQNKRVMITGANGLLGSNLVGAIDEKDPFQLILPGHTAYDLTDQLSVQDLLHNHKPDILIHAAGKVAGIKANVENPYDFFYENLAMGINIIEESRRVGVKKLILIGSVCSYPDFGPRPDPRPFVESSLWQGMPEKTVVAYGLAKRVVSELGAILGVKNDPVVICPILANLYGENDHFESKDSHVIPSLIRKIAEAKEKNEKELVLMGTGQAYREFLYAPEAAKLIVKSAEEITESLMFNLGSSEVLNISQLAHLIADLLGYKGEIKFSGEGPNGMSYRCLDSSEAKSRGIKASTTLKTGLKNTIDSYTARQIHYASIPAK